jgi:hypothetical protein
MRWFITAATLVLAASAAAACINDSEVEAHEREFKSHYLAPRPQESPSPEPSNLPLAAASGGLLLLTVAAVIAGRST